MKTVFRWPAGLLLAWAVLMGTSVEAAPTVQCKVSSSGELQQPVFRPISNPLSASDTNLDNGFRFSGVLLESRLTSATVSQFRFKSYVYYESKDRHVLIARQEWLIDSGRCNASLGLNEVYSSYLENHLTFECTATCPDKPAN